MSSTAANLRHKIESASDLKGVVRTMKALAASSISQYENSVNSLSSYYKTVELGLSASLRKAESVIYSSSTTGKTDGIISAIVFGSDQGLVGQFNEDIADFVIKNLAKLPGEKKIWAVGERVYSRLVDAGFTMLNKYPVPNGVKGISALVSQIQIDGQSHLATASADNVYVFYNKIKSGENYQSVLMRLLPLDNQWQQNLVNMPWPTNLLPEILCSHSTTLRALIREYIFISLYRACAESLASENASRLAAMQRAEKNINELLTKLGQEFHVLRQKSIDEELSDVLAGYELLNTPS